MGKEEWEEEGVGIVGRICPAYHICMHENFLNTVPCTMSLHGELL